MLKYFSFGLRVEMLILNCSSKIGSLCNLSLTLDNRSANKDTGKVIFSWL
uniref:Uncharacterized protein n=1 Tax=Arundo donax TaxID=35708 RepID=A0A0A9CME1_ARUDO